MKVSNLTIHKIYIFIILFSCPFLTGNVGMYKGQSYIYIQILLFMITILFIKVYNGAKIDKRVSYVLYFSFFIYLYYTFTTLLFTQKIISRDIVDFFRPFLYFFIIIFPIIIKISPINFIKLIKFVALLILIQIIMNLFIFIDLLEPIINIYKVQKSGMNYFKFSGTFGFAYTFSYFLLLGLIFTMFIYNKSYRLFFMVLIIFLTIMLSGSRAAMATTIFILLLIFIVERKKSINILIIKIFLLLITFIIIIIWSGIELDYFIKIFNYIARLIEKGTNDSSASHRIGEMELAFNILENNFLFGSGSNKYYINEIRGLHLESLYSYYLAKWGFVGFSLYVIQLIIISIISYNFSKLCKDNIYLYAFSKTLIYWIVSLFLFGLSISETDSYRGPFIFYTVVGYLFMLYFQKKDEMKCQKIK